MLYMFFYDDVRMFSPHGLGEVPSDRITITNYAQSRYLAWNVRYEE